MDSIRFKCIIFHLGLSFSNQENNYNLSFCKIKCLGLYFTNDYFHYQLICQLLLK